MILGNFCEIPNGSFHVIRPLQANSPEGTLPGCIGIGIVRGVPSFSLGRFDVCHLLLSGTQRLWGGKMAFVCSISRRSDVVLGRGKDSVRKICCTQALCYGITRRGINHLMGCKGE